MRQLNAHLNGGFNTLQIAAIDQPYPGMANCRYDITGFNTVYNPAADDPMSGRPAHFSRLPIIFQNGPLMGDAIQNGVTVAALLAVIEDHLQAKQQGPDACMENQMTLDYVRAALQFANMPTVVPYASQQVYAAMAG